MIAQGVGGRGGGHRPSTSVDGDRPSSLGPPPASSPTAVHELAVHRARRIDRGPVHRVRRGRRIGPVALALVVVVVVVAFVVSFASIAPVGSIYVTVSSSSRVRRRSRRRPRLVRSGGTTRSSKAHFESSDVVVVVVTVAVAVVLGTDDRAFVPRMSSFIIDDNVVDVVVVAVVGVRVGGVLRGRAHAPAPDRAARPPLQPAPTATSPPAPAPAPDGPRPTTSRSSRRTTKRHREDRAGRPSLRRRRPGRTPPPPHRAFDSHSSALHSDCSTCERDLHGRRPRAVIGHRS